MNKQNALPETWRWVRLGNTLQVSSGKNIPKAKMIEGGYPVYGVTVFHNQFNATKQIELLDVVLASV